MADLKKLGSPEIEHILYLAGRYQVSREACARRYVELCEHDCAVVFCHEAKIRSFWKSEDFPFIGMNVGEILPLSKSGRPAPVGRPSEWEEAASEEWGINVRKSKALYWQCMQQEHGYQLVLLTMDDSEGEDEDSFVESWSSPRFR